jgi:beta-lactamase superfamily II metal-dependent hydrolase
MRKKTIKKAAKVAGKIGKNIKTTKGKIIYAVVLVVIAAAVLFAGIQTGIIPNPFAKQEPQGDSCRVHYIDVGQGDCELIECGGKYMLIDAGENGHETEVLNYLNSLGVTKLDYVVASHQHSDHIGGLAEVLSEFEVATVIMPKLTKEQTPTNSTYYEFINAVKESGAKAVYAKVGASYELGGGTFEILGPVTDDAEDINSMSIVARFDYGSNSFLFTGDAEKDEEGEILETGANLDCDVLKVGHHGSTTSSGKKFLKAVSPSICVIPCGADNKYGHPHDEIVELLGKYTDDTYRTDICGDIVITSDGTTLTVEYENQ